MSNTSDLTVKILSEIRDEIRGTRVDLSAKIDQTNARLEETNQKVDLLARRQTETEVRLATEIVALAGAVDRTNKLLRERLDDRDRIDDIDRRVSALERAKH
ncbi:MAG: hypothetical protein J0L92_19485 [Deltaproteobacteria bacterium]|nr:hypothetical protein [Deltaproteobacteria bacterium]